ncbi:MAG: twin-arginine translocation signal domain-containing protein, partial [Ilumatobacteraceae bacterium]|nr:twin-arginine translocation signal domain-containing protein [Ilumatobacteraceae bacterium]
MPASVSRRELLKWASAGAGAAAVGGATWMVGRSDADHGSPDLGAAGTANTGSNAPRTTEPAPAATAAVSDLSQRLLVVVEMDGGNDGMSTLVPYGMSGYYDLRQRTAVSETDVLALDDRVGFHANLANVHRRGAAVLQGVGSSKPDRSHFEMMARRWSAVGGGFDDDSCGVRRSKPSR